LCIYIYILHGKGIDVVLRGDWSGLTSKSLNATDENATFTLVEKAQAQKNFLINSDKKAKY
jgi:hypothetical protein